jgi:hypothetical protein
VSVSRSLCRIIGGLSKTRHILRHKKLLPSRRSICARSSSPLGPNQNVFSWIASDFAIRLEIYWLRPFCVLATPGIIIKRNEKGWRRHQRTKGRNGVEIGKCINISKPISKQLESIIEFSASSSLFFSGGEFKKLNINNNKNTAMLGKPRKI